MRFMLLLIRRGPADPSRDARAMAAYNASLQRAGVLLAYDELEEDTTADEAHVPISAYWMIQARSREEAAQWARRCPRMDNEEIAVRQAKDAQAGTQGDTT